MKVHLLLLSLCLGQLAALDCFLENTIFRGKELNSIDKVSSEECYLECEATEECVGMMYNTLSTACALFRKIKIPITKAKFSTFVSAIKADCQRTTEGKNILFHMVNKDVVALKGFHEESVPQCHHQPTYLS